MEKEFWAEFGNLKKQALAALCEGEWELRLGVFPSFSANWVIGVRRAGLKRRVVEQRVWQREVDEEKFRTPIERMRHPRPLSPTIASAERMCTERQFRLLQDGLDATRVRIFPKSSVVGLDGTSFEVFVSDWFRHVDIKWWQSGPPAWRPLQRWFARTARRLARSIPNRPFSPSGFFPWESNRFS